MLRVSLPLFSLLFCTIASAQSPEPLPEPQAERSSEAYQRAANDLMAKALERLLARYDERLAEFPGETATALERCRFLQGVSYDIEGEPREPYAGLLESCLADLADAHAHDPRAVGFAVNSSYGEDRTRIAREALQGAALSWPPKERAKLRVTLARTLEQEGDTKSAEREARRALAEDSAADVSLLLGRAAEARGNVSEAKRWLTRDLDGTPVRQELVEKARLLHAISAHADALRAIDLAVSSEGVYVDELLRARILAAAGQVDAARVAYKKAAASVRRAEALSGSFELELAHGTAARAAAAYEAMRDDAFFSDPVLHHRLRLFWAHPGASWHGRDILGCLSLLTLFLSLFAIPAILLIPVHYAGLVLRQRRGDMTYAPSAWSIKRVSVLLGAWLSVQVLAALVFAYGLLDWLSEDGAPRPSDAELSAFGLAFPLGGLLVVAAIIRAPEIVRAMSSADAPTATAMQVVKGIGWVLLVAVANGLLVRGLSLGSLASEAALTADVTIRDILLAVQRCHGFGAMVLVAAVCVPLVEELVFRHALTGALEHHLSWRWANGLQAAAFALCHDQWTFWPTLFFIGWLAGRMRRTSDSLIGPVGLHAAWNLLVCFAIAAAAARHS